MAPIEKSTSKVRGSDAVKSALIEAAAELLGEVGPRGISVRDVADRAGVNHGQVHHYFGSKRGLLEAAMESLARGHHRRARERAGDTLIPPVLSLADDVGYWRALCQTIMDGDIDLARIEIDKDASIPLDALRTFRERTGREPGDLDANARFAILVAMQLGWVAFEDFMLLLTGVAPEDRETLRREVKRVMEGIVDQLTR